MDWLEPYEQNMWDDEDDEDDGGFPFRMKLIDEPHAKKRYTPLTQFFLLLNSQVSNEHVVTYLKINNGRITEEELCEIILHFDERKAILVEDKPIDVLLSRPNKDSLDHIKSLLLNPVIQSLFCGNIQPLEASAAQSYRVLPDKIEPYEDAEFEKVLSYLKKNHKNSSFSLQIREWALSDSLKDSYAIRYFAHHTQAFCLLVNQSARIMYIEMRF
ncbi:hypothetical protein [Pradoshia sp.]